MAKEIKLTEPQQRAIQILANQETWENSYSLRVLRNTLDALVRKGMVERRGTGDFGAAFYPEVEIYYRIKVGDDSG